MCSEVETVIEERWQDYETAKGGIIASLKADPANRYAHPKAWLRYAARLVTYSLIGSAALLLTLYVAMPQAWATPSASSAFNIWIWVATIGPLFLPLTFPAPIRYWATRADILLAGTNVPRQHKAF